VAEFAVSYDTVIKRREGGWVNHPQDPGSETYKGITKQFDPLWPGWQRVDLQRGHVGFPGSLERDPILQAMVRDFYHYGVWMKIRGDELGPQALADEMLDNATLQGPGAAIVFLQFALNAMNRGGSLYPDVTVDGGFGGKTLGALHSLMLREAPERWSRRSTCCKEPISCSARS